MSQASYSEFLESKVLTVESAGLDVAPSDLSAALFNFQRDIVTWALKRGRAAIFADCGLGKTPMQLEWARVVYERTGRDVLLLAPLAVSSQTVREGEKFGIHVNPCRTSQDLKPGINITNYERLHYFEASRFGAIVLDESSILKAYSGQTRKQITDFAQAIPYRLACTATPAPNDLIEIINHAEFLSIMRGKEIIALFFTQDGNSTHKWRLKGHAKRDFWQWLASWAVALRRPSDLGYSDEGFILPELQIHERVVESGSPLSTLFPMEAKTLEEQRAARRASLPARVRACAQLASDSTEPWLIWCDLNPESEALRKAIPGAVEVRGFDAPEDKERALMDFTEGRIRVLITKPSIAGFGMNWQHCANVAFVGISHSYEQFYQAVRRCWRFGQSRNVDCHIFTSEEEAAVVSNIQRKERQAAEMMENIVSHMKGLSLNRAGRDEMSYKEETATGQDWTLYLGDSIKRIDEIATDSIHLSIFSPPFPGMYAYTNSRHDIGNTSTINEMIEHFRFLVTADKLLRVTMPGRLCCIHLMQLTAMKSREGYIGLHDYRGRVIQMMIEEGWTYAGEVTIDKNPQIQATRNKERGLLFKSLATDSSMMRMALADYLIYFRKPGDNPEPIRAGVSAKYGNPSGWITEREWIEWASPVWYRQTKDIPGGIRETEVLNVAQARETDDERHLCPLQLGVIERAVKLWSNPGDLVFDPFTGVGSTGYMALKLRRRFIGCELKESYFKSAIINLNRALNERAQDSLFDALPDEEQAAVNS